MSENGRIYTTNANGETTIKGLSINQEYTLEETKAEGYYIASPIKFRVVNNGGSYSMEITEGSSSKPKYNRSRQHTNNNTKLRR